MKALNQFRIIALVSFFALLFSFLASFPATATEYKPNAYGARQAYLYNIENDKVIFSKGSETEAIIPASTVKIMSGLLATRRLEGKLDEYVYISSDMMQGVEGYTVGFKVGDTVTIKDLMYGLVCGGGNDAAHILAYICSGSVKNFVKEMNTEAKAIGMSNTVYKNPTGIDEHGMTTCIRDIALLSIQAISNPLYIELSSATEHKYIEKSTREERTIANKNPLISNYSAIGYKNKYVKGLSSGMTNGGGYCVSAYATNEKNSFLCIVMGGEMTTYGNISSYSIANELINYGMDGFDYLKIASKGDIIGSLPVDLALPTNGNQSVTVDCVLEKDVYAYVPKGIDHKQDLDYKIYYHGDSLTAPVGQNTVVGGIEIYLENDLLAEAKLITAEDIRESQLLVILKSMKKLILSRVTLFWIIILAPSLSAYFYFTLWHKKIKRKKALVKAMQYKKYK